MRTDHRGAPITGATAPALEAFEAALAAFQCWRDGAAAEAERATREAPAFVMAHVLRAWLELCSREPSAAQRARDVHQTACRLACNARERMHLGAIAFAAADDHERALAQLDAILADDPRDVLALQVAHAFDYLAGRTRRLRSRVAQVLPAWSDALPGFHAVLAMHAFGLEETGALDDAEACALRALSLEPRDARAHHVLAHVCEARGRPAEGVRWLGANVRAWAIGTTVATHCWWHLALFHLAVGHVSHALVLYDRRVRGVRSDAMADLIDASALLWRLHVEGADVGRRFDELARAFAPHVDDRFCTFSDLHAMLAFAGAGDTHAMSNLTRSVAASALEDTRHGATSRELGLPACRALAAFARGDDVAVVEGLAPLLREASGLGGSHAQRDILRLTMQAALERLPGRRSVGRAA